MFFSLLVLRSGMVASAVFLVIYLRQIRSYVTYEKSITIWGAFAVFSSAIINLTRTRIFIPDQIVADIIFVFILFLVIPNRFVYQVTLSLIPTLSLVGLIILNMGTATLTALLGLCFAYVIAISCAWQLNIYRRQSFHATVNREKTEEALRQSEERFRGLVESTSDWIWQVDRNGVYIYVSPKVTEILGFQRQEVLGKTPFDLMPKQEAEGIRKDFEEISKNKKAFFGLENWNIHKNGKLVLLESSGVPILDKEGHLLGYRGIDRDITERKKAEQELAQSKVKLQEYATDLQKLVELRTKQLQNSERLAAIGQTAGMVGHDIRNPLQAIAGDLYLIDNDVASLNDSETKKSLQESVESIQSNLMYIAKIVEDLQDYARPLKPNLEQVRIDKVIEQVMLIVPVTPNHQVILNVERDLPAFTCDFLMLKRVMTNLVQNALQAMPSGGRLTIQAYRKNASIFVAVKDTGVGIPEEFKPKIFMPMMTTKAKGQGLGLAVVKRLVEALNGTISFESQEGKGTTFTIEFPLAS